MFTIEAKGTLTGGNKETCVDLRTGGVGLIYDLVINCAWQLLEEEARKRGMNPHDVSEIRVTIGIKDTSWWGPEQLSAIQRRIADLRRRLSESTSR